MQSPPEEWSSGDVYEHFMGKWSSMVASLFMDWLQPADNLSWLDVGCGTGALTRTIQSNVQIKMMVGVDPSFDFLRYVGHKNPSVSAINADARTLPIKHSTFDRVVSGLALNFVPEPEKALGELSRVVKPGGVVAVYVWDYADKMEFLRYFWDAVVALDLKARSLHEGNRFPICNPRVLKQMWSDVGLNRVSVYPLDAMMLFESFDSYWQSFNMGSFPAPQYLLSLDTTDRHRLRDHLRKMIPVEEDGSVRLIARAWAVRGYKE